MARAAVKAKQQAKAKAQPAKPTRVRGRRRRGGSGGNPNQQLFFMRLRRGQKWLYAVLAIVFAATFAGVGVGSGSGGLQDLYSGLFGSGGNPVSKAQDEIKKNSKDPKGYRDLATAYETKSDNAGAITALQSYLKLKKKDATVWAELGGLQQSQASTYVTQYQQAQQASQLADPSQPFQTFGTLGQAAGANPVYANASSQATSQTSQLYQQAIQALNTAVTSYQTAAKLRPQNAAIQQGLASAAENAGNTKVAIDAWKSWLKDSPNSPQRAAIRKHIKQLEKSLPKPTKKPAKK